MGFRDILMEIWKGVRLALIVSPLVVAMIYAIGTFPPRAMPDCSALSVAGERR